MEEETPKIHKESEESSDTSIPAENNSILVLFLFFLFKQPFALLSIIRRLLRGINDFFLRLLSQGIDREDIPEYLPDERCRPTDGKSKAFSSL